MLTPLTVPPTSISPEDHAQLTSSTPASFVDIPPVLRWTDDVEVSLSPKEGGWETWSGSKVGGKLYVTEDAVAFIPQPPITPGFNLPFPSLTLHALTPASGDAPAHLYCQVDEGDAATAVPASSGIANGANGVEQDDEDEDDNGADEQYGEEDYTSLREVRIYLPESKLESLFQALSACSALHASLLPYGEPSSFFGFGDDADDDEGDDGEDGQWEDAEDDQNQDEDQSGQGGRVRIIRLDAAAPPLPRRTELHQTRANDAPPSRSQGDEGEDEEHAKEQDAAPVVDQMERFLNLVDWGNVQKPKGWEQ